MTRVIRTSVVKNLIPGKDKLAGIGPLQRYYAGPDNMAIELMRAELSALYNCWLATNAYEEQVKDVPDVLELTFTFRDVGGMNYESWVKGRAKTGKGRKHRQSAGRGRNATNRSKNDGTASGTK